jgi:hypothetical protein
MERDFEAIAAKLADLETNADWESAAREIHEAVVQILGAINELQERVSRLEADDASR